MRVLAHEELHRTSNSRPEPGTAGRDLLDWRPELTGWWWARMETTWWPQWQPDWWRQWEQQRSRRTWTLIDERWTM